MPWVQIEELEDSTPEGKASEELATSVENMVTWQGLAGRSQQTVAYVVTLVIRMTIVLCGRSR